MRSPIGGWQVVEEYESDDLASNSEDKEKRRVEQGSKRVEHKRQKTFHALPDHQLFRGRLLFDIRTYTLLVLVLFC